MAEAGRITQPGVALRTQPALDGAIAALATKQHAVLSLAQFDDLGLSAAGVRKRAADSRVHRIHRAVYSLVPRELLTREGHWMAAVLACGEGAVLSHRTAAALHGLRPTARAKVDVTIPRRTHLTHPRIDIHRSTTLTAADVTVVNGIPCTTVARTQFDLADVLERRSLERVFDQAEILEVFDLKSIEDQLARNPTRPAAGRVRALLDEYYIGSAPTESELEEAMFALCRRGRLALPEVGKWVDLHDGESLIKADFLWRAERVIVETDGARFHGTNQARQRDPRRDQRAILAGWQPVRTTWRQVMHRSQELESTLAALLARARADGG